MFGATPNMQAESVATADRTATANPYGSPCAEGLAHNYQKLEPAPAERHRVEVKLAQSDSSLRTHISYIYIN